jgi:hypothetical protein
MRIRWWPVLLAAACVADVDMKYVAGDDVDNEDTTITPDAGGPVTFDNSNPNYIDWHNDQGTFRIYTLCLGPNPGPLYIGHDGSVGPGYIATVWNKNGQIVTDDTAVISNAGPNGGRTVGGELEGATGLGLVGFHLARGYAPFAARDLNPDGTVKQGGVDHTHQISGRWCNANRRPDDYAGYRGWGVRSFSTPGSGFYVPPSVSGNVGQFSMDVVLGDAYSDLVTVRYTYRISSNVVKQWVRITTLCDQGTCDAAAAGGNAFVKEPKITVGVNPPNPDTIGFGQINIFNDTGHTGTTLDRHNRWENQCSESPNYPGDNFLCEWGGQNPVGSTGQCNDPQRRRVRFWHPQRACSSDPSCLVVAVRGVDTELGTSVPYQGAYGLDQWALRNYNEGREQANPFDTKADGFLENDNCHQNSAAVANRRWEMVGYGRTAQCSYQFAEAAFHSWEGGTGTYDCEPLYYRFGPAGESYVQALSYGFGAAPLP